MEFSMLLFLANNPAYTAAADKIPRFPVRPLFDGAGGCCGANTGETTAAPCIRWYATAPMASFYRTVQKSHDCPGKKKTITKKACRKRQAFFFSRTGAGLYWRI